MLGFLVPVMLLVNAAPPLAEATATQDTATLEKKANERIICRTIDEIGSRLVKKRICMTAQQWEEHRRVERESVDLHQQKKNQPGN